MIAGGLPKALVELDKIGKNTAIILYLLLDTIATSIGLMIVDYCMQSVSATKISIIIISLLLALPGKSDFENDKRRAG